MYYGIKYRKRKRVLSLPPSLLTASTKVSCNSDVQRMRDLLDVLLAEDNWLPLVDISDDARGS